MRGLVGLDDPVRQYLGNWELPESEYSEQEVTVRRLLSNSAGMPLGTIGVEYSPQSDVPSLRDTLAHKARLIREPGSGFLYSNTGFNLLELLIEVECRPALSNGVVDISRYGRLGRGAVDIQRPLSTVLLVAQNIEWLFPRRAVRRQKRGHQRHPYCQRN